MGRQTSVSCLDGIVVLNRAQYAGFCDRLFCHCAVYDRFQQIAYKNMKISLLDSPKQKTVLYFDQFLLLDLVQIGAVGGVMSGLVNYVDLALHVKDNFIYRV